MLSVVIKVSFIFIQANYRPFLQESTALDSALDYKRTDHKKRPIMERFLEIEFYRINERLKL